MALSDDQQVARDAVLAALRAGREAITLSGPAGSGKTTLMRTLIDDLEDAGRRVMLLAPTGKAAARLRDLTGRETTTIHRPLYKRIVVRADGSPEFHDPRSIADGRVVVVVDEASMVGTRLYRDLVRGLPTGAQLLCVGDREQLPPVQDTWGADFAAPTALLTQVHRQAEGSPIIRLATAIRTGQDWRDVPATDRVDAQGGYSRAHGTVDSAASWLAFQRAKGVDATLLTFANNTRRAVNDAVRRARGLDHEAIAPGDVLVCTRNHYGVGLMNGETRTVARVDWRPLDTVDFDDWGDPIAYHKWVDASAVRWRTTDVAVDPAEVDPDDADTVRPVYVVPEFLGTGWSVDAWDHLQNKGDPDIRNRVMQAEWGECLTVHKSQGSQWQAVGVVHDRSLAGMATRDPDTYRRIMYTAATRAARKLVIFEV